MFVAASARLVNVFTVTPGDQARLAGLLVQATNKTLKNVKGFVSASIHNRLDGVRVVNCAQWKSREDFEAMVKNPEAQAQVRPILAIATADFHLYEVVDTFER